MDKHLCIPQAQTVDDGTNNSKIMGLIPRTEHAWTDKMYTGFNALSENVNILKLYSWETAIIFILFFFIDFWSVQLPLNEEGRPKKQVKCIMEINQAV